MLKKTRQRKHGHHPTILSRWYASESYRDSLSEIGWKEKDAMLYDRIALEKHVYVATEAERIQNSKQWVLTLNAEGPQQPLNLRPDFAQATRECKRLHDEHLARTRQDYRTTRAVNKFDKEKNSSSKESKNSTTRLTLELVGGSTQSRGETCRQLRHRHRIGIEPIGRRAVGILSILQGLTICDFSQS